MEKIVVIGGSRGIGSAVVLQQLENRQVYNISRTAPELFHPNLIHYGLMFCMMIFRKLKVLMPLFIVRDRSTSNLF